MEAFDRLVLDMYESARHVGAHEFNEQAVQAIKRAFHFDSATLVDYGVSARNDAVIQTIHLHDVPIEKLHERVAYAGVETLTDDGLLVSRDVVLQAAVANRGRGIAADVRRVFRKDPLLDYCHRFDNAHSLVLASPTRDRSFSLAAFWRADRKNAYASTDVAMATRLLPHVLQARQLNQQIGALGMVCERDASEATVIATFDGQLYIAAAAGIRLLQREWQQWHPPVLPKALLDFLAGGLERRFRGNALEIEASVRGNMLCLRITATCRADGLTPAEHRVAKLAADGLQYKQIARLLHVAPATVRNQLQSVYRKLGVTNKTALAAVMRPQ